MTVITNQTEPEDLNKPVEELKETPEDKKEVLDEIEDDPDLKAKEEETPNDETPKDEEPVKKVETKEEVDYRERYAGSTREAMILQAKNKEFAQTFEEAAKIPEPTDEEMKTKYPTWDDMDEVTKNIAKESFVNTRRFNLVGEVVNKSKQVDEWVSKVDTFVTDPETSQKFKGLAGREEEFKVFAQKPTRIGVNFEDLVGSFLFEVSSQPKDGTKRTLFNNGSGGDKPRPTEYTAEQARVLRKTQPREWVRLNNAGKFDHLIQ